MTNACNLHYCHNDEFVQRCIEVWKFLYSGKCVAANEVPLFIAQMVYAEVILKKKVDWRTIKKSTQVTKPTEADIPRAPPSETPRYGLSPARGVKPGPTDEEYDWGPDSPELGEPSQNEGGTS